MNRSWIALSTIAYGIACSFGATAALAAPGGVTPDTKATFLHAADADSATNPVPILLASLGITAGDRIQIQRVGDFDNGPQGDDFSTTIGIFSSNSTLLAASNLHRVPGAIAAGVAVTTSPTFFGSEPTDIPEDFAVSTGAFPGGTICIVVPAGATHLFLCVHDSLYEDNSDPDGDYGYVVSLLDVCAADFDHNGTVDGADLGVLLGNWGSQTVIGVAGDLNCDGMVDGADLGMLLGFWGPC